MFRRGRDTGLAFKPIGASRWLRIVFKPTPKKKQPRTGPESRCEVAYRVVPGEGTASSTQFRRGFTAWGKRQ